MYPELFEIPFTHLTVKSYGLMMVIGFLMAVALIRRLSRDITPDPQMITNAALYSLIAGVLGARLFYVIHYFEKFKGDLLSTFAIWQGGLELLGGVVLAVLVIFIYLRHHKLPIRRYLDILAVALFLALAFGRIGCLLNGCCFGKPATVPWAVQFPYGSPAHRSQVQPNPQRNRPDLQLTIPEQFFTFVREDDGLYRTLKTYDQLTPDLQTRVDAGEFRPLPVHPTQLYSSANAGLCFFLLYLFWRRSQTALKSGNTSKPLIKPGCVFALMLILYGLSRFLLEFIRDDNPFEFDSLTISQNIGIALILFGFALVVLFTRFKFKLPPTASQPSPS